MVLTTYGRSTGFCIDPIEKKPLPHFLPGTSGLPFATARRTYTLLTIGDGLVTQIPALLLSTAVAIIVTCPCFEGMTDRVMRTV